MQFQVALLWFLDMFDMDFICQIHLQSLVSAVCTFSASRSIFAGHGKC